MALHSEFSPFNIVNHTCVAELHQGITLLCGRTCVDSDKSACRGTPCQTGLPQRFSYTGVTKKQQNEKLNENVFLKDENATAEK